MTQEHGRGNKHTDKQVNKPYTDKFLLNVIRYEMCENADV